MRRVSVFSWQHLEAVLSKGLRCFLFFLLVLIAFRVFFLCWMQEYAGAGVTAGDFQAAFWRGARLSCQSAGALALAAFVPACFLHYVWERGELYMWKAVTGFELVTLSILYVASFPYYRQFHSNFHQLLFNTANDDVGALFWSFVQEFYLPVRLAGALLLAYVLWRCLQFFLCWKMFGAVSWLNLPKPVVWIGRGLYLGGCCLVVLLGLFGGSLSWQNAVDWENAGVTRDPFLNEAILDNVQAVYRGYVLQHRMLACNGLDFTAEDIRRLAAGLSGRAADTDDLDVYLHRRAQGAQLEQPKHVFVVLSESYANWPLLEQYAPLHIADGMREVIRAEDSDYVPAFLPNGASTVSAVTGVVTGLADANLYLTTMPEAFAGPYPTASAPQMQRLGYETYFWYAGPATWERIGAFTQAQGYEHFFSRGDFGEVPGSVWGCEDKYLYARVLAGVPRERASFHVILNASNHSPYDVDLEAEGFPKDEVRRALPEEARDDEALLRELGHYWYADRELAGFIAKVKTELPDSLIVVVGDHADRYNMDKTPSDYERYGIPFIITGKGVHHGLMLPDAAGSQIDIVPTIVELIAPEGFEYDALGSSMSRTNRRAVNYGFWMTRRAMGRTDVIPLEPEAVNGTVGEVDREEMERYIDAVRSISWWRAKYGAKLDERLLEGR